MPKKLISIILPIYNEEGNIELLHKTLSKTFKTVEKKYDFEFVFINDGSRDASLELLYDLVNRDKRVSVLNFSRNYGHQIAVTAGIDYAEGDAAIIMDADMQDPPRVALEMIERWEDGFDVVYAQRRTRQDSFFKKLTAKWFYIFLRKLSDIDIPPNTGDFRLVDKRVLLEMRKFKEHNRFLRGIVSFIGFKQTAVLFDRDKRHAGVTGYPLKKMLKFAADGILSFSTAPLKFITNVGFFFAVLSLLGIVYTIVVKLILPATVVEGWAFIVISILLVGGVQLIMLGVLGSYIGRIYTGVQNRPLYAIESIVSGNPKRHQK